MVSLPPLGTSYDLLGQQELNGYKRANLHAWREAVRVQSPVYFCRLQMENVGVHAQTMEGDPPPAGERT